MTNALISTRMRIYIALAAAVIAVIFIIGNDAWSGRKVRELERRIDEAKQTTTETEKKAAALELDAAAYKEKIAYLEDRRNEIGETARKQDDEITKRNSIARTARADVARVRGVRSNDASFAELCQKLAALGHTCSE
ncbi:MAG: hypothetical protein ABJA02_06335 [Acidobacteriota bacterium]